MYVLDVYVLEKYSELSKTASYDAVFLLLFSHKTPETIIILYKELPEVNHLRTQEEILAKVNIYKQQLADAIKEKTEFSSIDYPEIDLIIFSLVDKLEALLWVLEVDLPEGDILDRLLNLNH